MRVLSFLPFCSSWKKQEQRGWVALSCVHPTLVAQTGPSCLGCKGLAVLGTQQVPTAKVWKLHKCFVLLRTMRAWSDHSGTLSSSFCGPCSAPLCPSLLFFHGGRCLSSVWAVLSASGRSRGVLQSAPASSCSACPASPKHLPRLLSLF